jgi:outer membrane biosynthesis protein TonB
VSDSRTDYSRHTDEELREGIAKAGQQDPRIARESSGQALAAERDQRRGMAEELQRRRSRAGMRTVGRLSMKVLRGVPAALLGGMSVMLAAGSRLAGMGARALAPPSGKGAREPSPAAETAAPHAQLPEPGETVAVAPIPPAGTERPPEAGAGEAERPVAAEPAEAARERSEAGEGPPEQPQAHPAPEVQPPAEAAPPEQLQAEAGPPERPSPEFDQLEGPEIEARQPQRPEAAAPETSEAVVTETAEAEGGGVDEQGQARTYESHVAELADRNVAGVMREIPDLSTEELGQLFEYESAHRKRKTVLQAIERAAAPGGGSGSGG